MQLATTLKGVTAALATLDTLAVGYFPQVSASIFQSIHVATVLYTTVPLCDRIGCTLSAFFLSAFALLPTLSWSEIKT